MKELKYPSHPRMIARELADILKADDDESSESLEDDDGQDEDCDLPVREVVELIDSLMQKENNMALTVTAVNFVANKLEQLPDDEIHAKNVLDALVKASEMCKNVVKRVIKECIQFCAIINKHHFIMSTLPYEKFIAQASSDKSPLDTYKRFFQLFFDAFIEKMKEHSKCFDKTAKKLLGEYAAVKKKCSSIPKIAAQNKAKLEKECQDLKTKVTATIERNEKCRAKLEQLTKIHEKRLSEDQNYEVRAQSSNVHKKSVADLLTKLSEKEADMERIITLLGVLKRQLLDVRTNGMQQHMARVCERDAKKARIKELSAIADDLNANIRQQETALVVLKKNSVAVMKAERERLQELDLTFLQLRLQNITRAVTDFITYREHLVAEMCHLMAAAPAEKKQGIFENIKIAEFQIRLEREKFKRIEAAYKHYMVLVGNGAMLADLAPIDLNSPGVPATTPTS